ncbi:MAG: lamin tail domain-containing protein [Panacagrimonas sp.]
MSLPVGFRVRALVAAALAFSVQGSAQAAAADLFFSEYVEGSSNNKALEIGNLTATPVDLAAGQYVVQMYFNGSLSAGLTIPLTGTVGPGDVFVLAQAGANATILAQADQTSGSGWFNGDDAVVLRKGGAGGTLLDVIGQIGNDPGTQWGSDLASTADNTLRRKAAIQQGDTVGTDAFDPALEWDGFANDSFDGLGALSATPPPPPPPPQGKRIHQIQGTAHRSPFEGQTFTVPGVVTAIAANGFYLQDPEGDGDARSSDALFVFTGTAPTVSRGQEVEVVGTVTEFRPGGLSSGNLTLTELTNPSVQPAPGRFASAAIAATIIGEGGRVPPAAVIDDDTLGSVEVAGQTTFDPEHDGIDFYESLEGMLVQVRDALVIAPTNRFGETWVVGDEGRRATGLNARGGLTLRQTPDGIDYNPERIQIDDGLPGVSMPAVNVGDRLGTLTGVLSYAFGNFELLPLSTPQVQAGTLQPERAEFAGTGQRLTLASYNVENLDPNDADGDADVAGGRFDRIAAHVVDNLRAPDILALQEIQDDSGSANDGTVTAGTTLATLARAIVAAGGPAYTAAEIAPFDGQEGGQPGGNIRVAYLYNPARVALVPGTLGAGDAGASTAPALLAGRLALTLSPGRVQPLDPAFDNSRKPLAAVFEFRGRRVVVVNNHFSSKGGSDPLFGFAQPPLNGGEAQRNSQAAVVHGFVRDLLAADAKARVVVLGDLNEFSFLPPLETLRGDPEILTDLGDALLPETERYSYVFEGNAQELDHLLVSPALIEGARFDVIHVNAEFGDAVSDHDPSLASLCFSKGSCPGRGGGDADGE